MDAVRVDYQRVGSTAWPLAGFLTKLPGEIVITPQTPGEPEQGVDIRILGPVRAPSGKHVPGEGGVLATITVTRTGGSEGAVSIDYATSNGNRRTRGCLLDDYVLINGPTTASRTYGFRSATVSASSDYEWGKTPLPLGEA